MPFSRIEAQRLPAAAARQIELLILRGVLRPGTRLPPERELAERMGVSRPSLREALAELHEAGLVDARPGAGVFVAEVLGSAFSPALIRLFGAHDEAVFDFIAFRRDLEGLAAERAARHAGAADLAVIRAAFERMEAGIARRGDGAALDAAFHLAILEAAHNVVLLHVMRSIYDLLREGVFYNRQIMFARRTTRAALLEQHRGILTALEARDPAGARAAVEAHMDYVAGALRDHRRAERNDAVARQRLERGA